MSLIESLGGVVISTGYMATEFLLSIGYVSVVGAFTS